MPTPRVILVALALALIPAMSGIAVADEESDRALLSLIVKGLGRNAELSVDELYSDVHELEARGIAHDDALAVVSQFARNTKVSRARINEAITFVPVICIVLGQSPRRVAQLLGGAISGSFPEIRELDRSLNLTTPDEWTVLTHRLELHKTSEAVAILMKALHARLDPLLK
jgi:hypothetical protein